MTIGCPQCGHTYQSLVLEGAHPPKVWTCSGCGGREAEPVSADDNNSHPWAGGCIDACCG